MNFRSQPEAGGIDSGADAEIPNRPCWGPRSAHAARARSQTRPSRATATDTMPPCMGAQRATYGPVTAIRKSWTWPSRRGVLSPTASNVADAIRLACRRAALRHSPIRRLSSLDVVARARHAERHGERHRRLGRRRDEPAKAAEARPGAVPSPTVRGGGRQEGRGSCRHGRH